MHHKMRQELANWLHSDSLAPTARRLSAMVVFSRSMVAEEAMYGTTWVPFWLEREQEAMRGLMALLKEAVVPSASVV